MTFIIVKAKVGYIVRPENYRMGEMVGLADWAAFDSWEQAATWIGEQFRSDKA